MYSKTKIIPDNNKTKTIVEMKEDITVRRTNHLLHNYGKRRKTEIKRLTYFLPHDRSDMMTVTIKKSSLLLIK